MKVQSRAVINLLIVTLFIVFLYAFCNFKIMRISGNSMSPYYPDNQIILVYRGSYGLPYLFKSGYFLQWKKPDKEDIIVFHNPIDDSLSVKRCIGIPGDTLFLKHDTYYLNEKALPPSPLPPAADFRGGIIGNDWFFLMGDNYSKSIDSRMYGPIPMELILGKVLPVKGKS
ncbi:MAG: signal peptidase I [Spirochaetales bacterium]|nr:signal peptidase I [Spirochaetales bacterium]